MSDYPPQSSSDSEQLVNSERIINQFLSWEEGTKDLCQIGYEANRFIDDRYLKCGSDPTWFIDPSFNSVFSSLVGGRAEYWKEEKVSIERAKLWASSIEEQIKSALSAKDRLGAARAWIWGRGSTYQIILDASRSADEVGAELKEIAEGLVLKLESYKESLLNAKVELGSVSRVAQSSTSSQLLKSKGIKNHLNIYLVKDGERDPRYVELVESWRLFSDQVTICVPLSVGCPNRCSMCDLGAYFGGDLAPQQILHLLNTNFIQNVDIPIKDFKSKLKIYLLGGGDALLYKNLGLLIDLLLENFPNAQQIYSSIGLKNRKVFDELLKRAAVSDRVGFQFSLCSLDSKKREAFVVSDYPKLTVDECVEWANEFYRVTKRKAHLSIFIDREDKVEDILSTAKDKLSPNAVHISLTTLSPSSLPYSKVGADISVYNETLNGLLELGYSAHICTNDIDPENSVSCGVMEDVVREGNRTFYK